MDTIIKDKFKKSALAALIIALLFPAMWYIFTGTTNRTPVVEEGHVESMTNQDREKWFQDNMKSVGLLEHAKSTPRFIINSWRGYAQTSLGIFIVIFALNGAYILGGIGNKP